MTAGLKGGGWRGIFEKALSSGPQEWVQGGVWGLNLLALEFGFRLEAKRLGAEAMRFGTTAMLLSH